MSGRRGAFHTAAPPDSLWQKVADPTLGAAGDDGRFHSVFLVDGPVVPDAFSARVLTSNWMK